MSSFNTNTNLTRTNTNTNLTRTNTNTTFPHTNTDSTLTHTNTNSTIPHTNTRQPIEPKEHVHSMVYYVSINNVTPIAISYACCSAYARFCNLVALNVQCVRSYIRKQK